MRREMWPSFQRWITTKITTRVATRIVTVTSGAISSSISTTISPTLAAWRDRAARTLLRLLYRIYHGIHAHRVRLVVLGLLFGCIVLVPGALVAGSGVSHGSAAHRKVPVVRTDPFPANLSQAIIRENQQPGTSDWIVPPERVAANQIQAYASAASVAPGDSITFYASVQDASSPYEISIYRLGWYGGAGGRLLLTTQRAGQVQGYYDADKGQLISCTTCRVDRSTGLAEANWQPSFQLTIPPDWLTGVYLAQFIGTSGKQTTVPFDVGGDPHSTYVAVTTDTTVQAYNEWGGASLYVARYKLPNGHASKVSFDRPVAGWATVQGLLFEIDGIRWLERGGYDVSYISSVDLHEHPDQLLGHRAFLDFGHDEYWSKEMRDGVERARDAGIGLAFVGANAAYWQMRFEPDSRGAADRTVVCYKSALRDPYFWGDRSRLTVQWRDPWLNRPENSLLGEMYSDWTSPPRGFPWHVSTTAHSSLFGGTNLQPGQKYGCDLVGYEWDKVFNNGRGPANLQILSVSQAASVGGKRDYSNTTYYVAPSGALVFDAGSIKWDFALDDLRLTPDRWCNSQHAPVTGMQKLLANVLAALIVRQTP